MMGKRFVVCLLLLMGANALADQNTKQAKLRQLMELQGLAATMAEHHATLREQAREVGPMLMAQFKKQLPDLDAATLAEMEAAMSSFVETAASQGSPAESIDIWIRHYGEHVTEAELDQIVAYYRSPVGHKDVAAQGLAGERWTAFIMERNNKALETATKGFFEHLNGIVQRAAAKKRASQSPR